jgi:hypothetical protein
MPLATLRGFHVVISWLLSVRLQLFYLTLQSVAKGLAKKVLFKGGKENGKRI